MVWGLGFRAQVSMCHEYFRPEWAPFLGPGYENVSCLSARIL